MNRKHAKRMVVVGFSLGAVHATEAAQAFAVNTGGLSAFQDAHPILMMASHALGILVVLGVFAIVLAGITRGPTNL